MLTRDGSNMTLASPVSKDTFALATPFSFCSALVTLLTQPAQVIPLICSVVVSKFGSVSQDKRHEGQGSLPGFQRRSSKEFVTTDTELIAIAAPATIGFSQPSAASGIPSALYPKAKTRF